VNVLRLEAVTTRPVGCRAATGAAARSAGGPISMSVVRNGVMSMTSPRV